MKSALPILVVCLFALGATQCSPGGAPSEDQDSVSTSQPKPEPPKESEAKPAKPNQPMKNTPDPGSDQSFVGLSLSEAEKKAEEEGLRHRVVMVDGQHRPATRDYRPDRVNFTVENGKVTGVSRG